MSSVEYGVKITPDRIVIKDAVADAKIDITLQNFSKNSKSIRLRGPETENFVLKAPSEEQLVASGLVINATLFFKFSEEKEYRDKIITFIDNTPVTVPIHVLPPAPQLSFESPISFGISIPDGLVLTRYVDIRNTGKRAGNFRIDYAGDQPIRIFPCVGTIEPNSSRTIKIEFISRELGTWEEVAGVELEGSGYMELRMVGEVRPSSLVLLDITGSSHLQLIKFGTTMFECEKFQPAVLFNNGPTSLGFVIILEEGGVGQEIKSEENKVVPRNLTSCITASPNQGGIGPYEKVVINFCFSPSSRHLQTEWERSRVVGNEFVVFMHIVPITTVPAGRMMIDAEYVKQNKLTPLVEVGVTGRPVDVAVDIAPATQFNLGCCEVGQSTTTAISLTNNNTLPLQFNFAKAAHFTVSPITGEMMPGEEVIADITFAPSQFGNFTKKIQLDILGIGSFITNTNTDSEPKIIAQGKNKIFKKITLQVKGQCKVSNLNKNTKVEDIKTGARKQTKFDLYSSIRPSNDRVNSLTTFTKVERYSYVDRDYAYSEGEKEERERHRDKYKNYIDSLRTERLAKLQERTERVPSELKAFDTDVDLGIKPACGLKPPKVKQGKKKNLEPIVKVPEGLTDKVMTSVELATRQATLEQTATTTNNTPTTPQEKRECSMRLTPQQMHQIVIGPATLDFGEVAIRTVNTKPLVVMNHLDTHVYIQLDIDCRELRQSLPLTQVVPPRSLSKVDVCFESQKAGAFQRSVVYTVNNHIKQHVNILAKIVSPEISLSESEVVLRPTLGIPHSYGYNRVIKLQNTTNGAAEFVWRPDQISPFAIRPSQGTVEPHSTLNCEVLYFPSVISPLGTEFTLDVVEGNSERLSCIAEFASPSVKFAERRLSVGVLPLHVQHRVAATLKNTGHHHAYFQVINPSVTPFCTVKPESGCIPVGGVVDLELHFFAVEIEKFDFRVEVGVRGGRRVSLRVGGSVEPPLVECDLDTFAFAGVHVGSTLTKHFTLFNPMSSEAAIVYNLTKFTDFTLDVPHRNFADDGKKNYSEGNFYYIYLSPGEKVNMRLTFAPEQVASYDFNLPVLINDMIAPPPPTRKAGRSSGLSESYLMGTPCRRVTATAMFPVLSVSPLELSFKASPYLSDSTACNKKEGSGTWFKNEAQDEISFALDIRPHHELFEKGSFRFINEKSLPFLPPLVDVGTETWQTLKPGEQFYVGLQFMPNHRECKYQLEVPVRLKGLERYPYRVLTIGAELLPPVLTFSAEQITLLPTPLKATITTTLEVTATNFLTPINVAVTVDKIRSDEGQIITPLVVSPSQISLPPCSADCPSQSVTLELVYCSDQSVSFSTALRFTGKEQEYAIPVVGTSENCLLTNYPFVNSNPRFHMLSGETDCSQQYIPPTATPSTVSLSSAQVAPDSAPPLYTPVSTLSLREGAKNAFRAYVTPVRAEAGEELEEGDDFLLQVLSSAERWISQMGWGNMPNPVSIPNTIWDTVLLKKGTVSNDGGKRKSVFELVQNLCGRAIPGIPVNPPIPNNAQERVKQLHWQLSTMLTFLRVQGAKLTHIKAEWFMSPADFLLWSHLNNFENEREEEAEEELLIRHTKFSSQAWVDLVLQLAKVFVLIKVKPIKSLPINPDSYKTLARSVYSTEERVLLAWLSYHYETQRKVVWPEGTPQTRWVISFDNDLLDGLVLATLLSAYCPFLVAPFFSDMYLTVRSPEECFHNALNVIHALRSIGIDYDIHPTDIMQPNAINMLLFCTHLYISLPQYKPKATVSFEGVLHQPVVKELKIQNPSNKAISYAVSVVGQDTSSFSVHPPTLNIGGGGSGVVKITFSSNWLHPCTAAVMLVSRRTGTGCGSTLLFNLSSIIKDIVPVKTSEVESAVYERSKFALTVTNPLSAGGIFKVVLVEGKGLREGLKKKRQATSSDTTVGTYDPTKVLMSSGCPSSFWCDATTVQLAAGGTANLQMEFLPLSPGARHCSILFSCPGVGEFLQNIEGLGLYPRASTLAAQKPMRLNSPIDKLRKDILGSGSAHVVRFRCDPSEELGEKLVIPGENPQKMQALIETAKHRMSDMEIRRRQLTGTLATASLMCLERDGGTGEDKDSGPEDETCYEVHCNSKHYTFPAQIRIDPERGAHLPFTFKASGQGFYPARIVLVSSTDIRLYEVEVTCTPSTTEAEIHFTAPTLQSVVQNIPIINETHYDWNLSATIEGENYFGPPTILAKSCSTTLYPLLFKPTYQGEIEGELTLTNVANGTVNKFKLMGTGLKPLPQEAITMRCHARQRCTYTAYVHNPSERVKTFQAFTDLDCIVGLHEVTVDGGISVPYEITAYPIAQGRYSGVISFESVRGGSMLGGRDSTASNGTECHTVWYSIEVIVDPPPPEKTVDLFCEAKKALTLELSISNPTDREVIFDVHKEGPGISGPPTVSVGPRTEASYEILYSPQLLGKDTGKVVFVSEELGEFWYDLRLNAEKPRPVALPEMVAELGKVARTVVPVANETTESALVNVTVTNPTHFVLHNMSKLSIPPKGKIDLELTFIPSALSQGSDQACLMEFSSPQLGEWSYTIQGQGTRPTVMNPVVVSCGLGEATQTLLQFKNPLNQPIQVNCKLLDRNKVDKNEELFELLLGDDVITVAARGILEVPFSFRPLEMVQASAHIIVEVVEEGSKVDGIKWQFPLKGMPVYNVSKSYQQPVIGCKAKERKECFLEVILDPAATKPCPSLEYSEATITESPVELASGWQRQQSEREFSYSLDDNGLLSLQHCSTSHITPPGLIILTFNLVFSPGKPTKKTVNLTVDSTEGGRWVFPFTITATPATPDDSLVIRASGLHKDSVVGIRLNSLTNSSVPYRAHLEAGSDPDFRVFPDAGQLLPLGTEGTLLCVAYKPTLYGKIHNAKLIVQTADNEWSYVIQGQSPSFSVPVGVATTPLRQSTTASAGTKKNFIRQNMKKIAQKTP